MQRHESLDLVTEHLDANGVLLVHREDFDRVAPHPKGASLEADVIARVLDIDEASQQRVALDGLANAQSHHPIDVFLRCPESVDGRDTCHDNDVAAGEEAVRRRVPQSLHLLIDRGVLLDEGIALRNVCLWLVIVVVGDEVLDGVVRQEFLELRGQLCGKGLVRSHDERRALQGFDQPGGRRTLACTGGPEQHGVALTGADALRERCDRSWLITGWLERCLDLKRSDPTLEVGHRPGHVNTLRLGARPRCPELAARYCAGSRNCR
ncbi:unannotated protein [freshwater metagenome]|uniref:Unannotated protein n=1 Tax=freshwater metagenome TaxID=449393 RepID=A0A6J7RAF0_9ZZZZ